MYSVYNLEFLIGVNIFVCLIKDFMDVVENDGEYEFCFSDVESYLKEEMVNYNENWYEVGDVCEWVK